MKSIKAFYWATFGLSIVILPLNFGLGLVAIGHKKREPQQFPEGVL